MEHQCTSVAARSAFVSDIGRAIAPAFSAPHLLLGHLPFAHHRHSRSVFPFCRSMRKAVSIVCLVWLVCISARYHPGALVCSRIVFSSASCFLHGMTMHVPLSLPSHQWCCVLGKGRGGQQPWKRDQKNTQHLGYFSTRWIEQEGLRSSSTHVRRWRKARRSRRVDARKLRNGTSKSCTAHVRSERRTAWLVCKSWKKNCDAKAPRKDKFANGCKLGHGKNRNGIDSIDRRSKQKTSSRWP